MDGQFPGIFAGYRRDLGDVVVGGEVDYTLGSVGIVSNGVRLEDADYEMLRVGGELGFDAGNALPYLTAGYTYLELSRGSIRSFSGGYFAGAGLDFRLSETITVGAELLFHDFRDWNQDFDELQVTTFGLNVAFTF